MAKYEYGLEFLYEQYGRMAMENAILQEKLASAQRSIFDLNDELDAKSKEITELLAQEAELRETIKNRDATIVFLDEQLSARGEAEGEEI